jgi:hypothetical protein
MSFNNRLKKNCVVHSNRTNRSYLNPCLKNLKYLNEERTTEKDATEKDVIRGSERSGNLYPRM